MHRHSRRRTAWFVLVTMVLGLLLPTVAHAVGQPAATVWTEICTAQGMKPVPVGADTATEVPVSLHGAMDHCPWCLLTAAPAWAPPPADVVWRLPLVGQAHPERRFTAPRTPQPWRWLQARAPPPPVA
jgi:hypothetical protein